MTATLNILLTGATGYIGGSVLHRLLQHPNHSAFHIRTLVRKQDKAEKLKTIYPQVQTVIGSLEELELLQDLAASSDIVIATADIDNMEAAKAILAGLKMRYERVGVPSILIHTSGTDMFTTDDPNEIYDDLNSEQFSQLPITRMHRTVDLVIANADAERYVRTYIIIPSNVYGLATGPLVDAGVQNKVSMFLHAIIKLSLKRDRGGTTAGADNQMHLQVHIDDCADLYITLLDAIMNGHQLAGHGHDGYYICENGECNMGDYYRSIASAVQFLLKRERREPTLFTYDELVQYLGEQIVNSNYLTGDTRGNGNRSRGIGWKPVHPTQDLLDGMLTQVKVALNDVGRWVEFILNVHN